MPALTSGSRVAAVLRAACHGARGSLFDVRDALRVQLPPGVDPGHHAVRQLGEVGVHVREALAHVLRQLQVQLLRVLLQVATCIAIP